LFSESRARGYEEVAGDAGLDRQLGQLRAQGKRISAQIPQSQILNDQKKALFYSNWHYSATRLLTSIPAYSSVGAIAERLRLPYKLVSEVVEFLLHTGLCVQKDGALEIGPSLTHLDADSPFVARHHANWRLKSLERHDHLDHDRELAYTGPMTLSRKDAQRVRSLALELVRNVVETAQPSSSEVLYCLNVDWFEV
jgi:hypothetical protein